jgi:glucosylceramidase
LDDPEAAKYIWGVGFHWYGRDCFDNVQKVHDAYPYKQLLFTEGCQEGGPHFNEWNVGERYAKSMINDLNRWTVGWTDWNLVLDSLGGPNHVNNMCSAPIMVFHGTDSIYYHNSYYYIGHISKFIKPGAVRIVSASTYDELEITAFKNKNNTIAVVVLNRTDNECQYFLKYKGASVKTLSAPHSIMTYVFQAK